MVSAADYCILGRLVKLTLFLVALGFVSAFGLKKGVISL